MNRYARFAFRCSAILCIIILSALCVRGDLLSAPSSYGPATEPSPGFVPPADASAAAAAPATQTLVAPLPQVTDEQVGVAITRGVDFLLSNFDHSQLKPIDGEGGAIDHAGLNALCVDALLEAQLATHDPRLKPNEPLMKAVLDHLKHEPLQETDGQAAPLTYAHAMRAVALGVNNRPEDHSVLVADVEWLLRANRDGAYTFDDHFPPPVQPASTQEPLGIIVHGTMGMSSGGSPPISAAGGFSRKPVNLKTPIERSLAPTPLPNLNPSPPPNLRPSPLPPLGPSGILMRPPPLTGDRCIPGNRGGFLHPRSTTEPFRPALIPPNTEGVGPSTVGYGNTPVTPSTVSVDPYPWDAMDSELGLLGVWAGAEAGIDVPSSYWTTVQNHWLRKEIDQGTWSYNDQLWAPSIGPTFAGTWALSVTHDWMGAGQRPEELGREPYPAGLKQALKWMATGDNSVIIKDDQTNFVGYNLFILARLGQASGYKFFGSHDWYRELAARVIPTQWPNGAFGRSLDGYDAVVQTAYTLIFLSSGRHPIFMEKLQFDGSWANRPRDVSSVTRFASRELERSMNWEVVPLSRDYTDWLDSRVLYIASHEAPVFGPGDIDKLRGFVGAGGLLFTHADNGSAKFDDFVEHTLAPALFPGHAMQDIPADDPIYSVQYKMRSSPPKLRGINDGSRWVLVHSSVDLAHHWQARDEKQSRSSFELAVNLFVYANGSAEPKNRLCRCGCRGPDVAAEPLKLRVSIAMNPGCSAVVPRR